MVSLYLYGLIGLADFQDEFSIREHIGLYLVVIFSISIFVNICLFFNEAYLYLI